MGVRPSIVLDLSVLTFEKKPIKYTIGDIDNNGKIDTTDARFVLRAALNKSDSGLDFTNNATREFLSADANKNGIITVADARLILRAAIKLDTLKK